jgi:hypothetical protein
MHKLDAALILGSGPDALQAQEFPVDMFEKRVAINNAWRVRNDWNYLIHPDDFPADRWPSVAETAGKHIITSADYVPLQNRFGGFVYAGGTMAFTAGYWALAALTPKIMGFFGCDMVYSDAQTHFYGQGTADPLRNDISLQSLEAKSARMMIMATLNGSLCINLTANRETRLVFPKVSVSELAQWTEQDHIQALEKLTESLDMPAVNEALTAEKRLNYFVESGEYWKVQDKFDAAKLREIDEMWLKAAGV